MRTVGKLYRYPSVDGGKQGSITLLDGSDVSLVAIYWPKLMAKERYWLLVTYVHVGNEVASFDRQVSRAQVRRLLDATRAQCWTTVHKEASQ